ncbi:MAG: DUF402 domain-containing protein [Lachnospiraceae bacterium]|nr:DUF402 domain-containing protein [Lachnospiraceae bacterium]
MTQPILFRKRIIPDECVRLGDDQILYVDDDIIVTGWKALHPKPDLAAGYSCYYLHRGYKINKFLNAAGELLYWYCDIVDYGPGISDNRLISTDLLVDVVIRPDGSIRIIDLDELSEAFDRHLIDDGQIKAALNRLSDLLNTLYSDGIEVLAGPIERFA